LPSGQVCTGAAPPHQLSFRPLLTSLIVAANRKQASASKYTKRWQILDIFARQMALAAQLVNLDLANKPKVSAKQ